jgi:lactoylglutathione lyase
MPIVTWDHVHLRSPDPEATATWLQDILGGVIIRGPGRIDVKLGGANVFIAPVKTGDGVNAPPTTPYQGLDHFGLTVKDIDADHDPAGRPHLLHPRPARHFDRTAGA